ncbi:FG-GAP-like repeat-containing protein [Salsipaludibacter albus]|uniref:FG-GAP-like repeat-containing protein n=1 Tax=Salsipaludibacter albus TaxID=2849650 RepID=UPI001EE474FE|nr:FG-GAP-like repeat-containing protein [Salsipaludibacter albus]MBY5162463.1 FG-GAP repeat protein [Salsipaludibacter albus]
MRLGRTIIAAIVLALAAAGTAAAAPGFLEDDVVVIDRLDGEEVNGWYGWVAANVDDVDGDGVDDLAVPEINHSPAGAGKVTVYSGATREVLAEHLGAPGNNLGWSTSAAGDVDGDGVPDYAAGGPGASASDPGRVVVWSGADHGVLLDLDGPAGLLWGFSVSAAGDVDGDGHDDVALGALFADGNRGRVSVRSGADGTVLWSISGPKVGDLLGSALGLVGDVDGDGTQDLAVGATGGGHGGGVAFVVSGVDGTILHRLNPQGDAVAFGQFFASGAGDVDGDGIGDVYVGDFAGGKANQAKNPPFSGAAYVFSGATGERLHRFTGELPGEGVGPGRGVGDVDGDGHADLVVAGYLSGAGAPTAGKAWVRSGRTGDVLQEITSTTAGENFGVDALGLGDVDGDGRTDFVVTAVGLSFAGTAPGTAYVVAGTTG